MEEVTVTINGPITLAYLNLVRRSLRHVNEDHVVIGNRPVSPGGVLLIRAGGTIYTGLQLTFLFAWPKYDYPDDYYPDAYRMIHFRPLLHPDSPTTSGA